MVISECQIRPDRRPGRRRGFTLIELLVVLVIMGLVVAVVTPSLVRTQATELKSAARSVAAGLRSTRSRALTQNRAASLTLDLEKHWFRIAGEKRERALPAGVQLALFTARSELQSDVRGAIRFFPDGSSTGGRVTLSTDRLAYLVDVDWLTGRVRLLQDGAQVGRQRP